MKSVEIEKFSQSFNTSATNYKLKAAGDDNFPINYELLSNDEKQNDKTNFNLLNCKIFNSKLKKIRKLLGFDSTDLPSIEDYNDDNKSTRMSDDTKAIKEFYKLSIESNILIHFQDICVETGREKTSNSGNNFMNFLTRMFLEGDEITEQLKVEKTPWIKKFLNFFKAKSK